MLRNFCPECASALSALPGCLHKKCSGCEKVFYDNPVPVSLAIVPVYYERPEEYGLLMITRAISPGRGMYAFPGGNQDTGETGETAVARELEEETAIVIPPREFVVFGSDYSTQANRQMTFWLAPHVHVSRLEAFAPNREASAYQVWRKMHPGSVAFTSHETMTERFFSLSYQELQTIRRLLGRA